MGSRYHHQTLAVCNHYYHSALCCYLDLSRRQTLMGMDMVFQCRGSLEVARLWACTVKDIRLQDILGDTRISARSTRQKLSTRYIILRWHFEISSASFPRICARHLLSVAIIAQLLWREWATISYTRMSSTMTGWSTMRISVPRMQKTFF